MHRQPGGRRGPFGPAGFLVLVGLWGALCGIRPAGAAVYDPVLEWRTLETAHFNIHHPVELGSVAARLAVIAEEVHGPMVELLGWQPRQPTEVTVVDRTDLANGYTVVLPYNQMVLYPVQPALFQTIADYDEWLRLLFVHEYAHVLGIDPVRGYPAVLRKIFGRVGIPVTPAGFVFWFLAAPPNLFLPPWFHEGLATNFESELTGRGRRGSTLYRMYYRMDLAEGAVPPLDRLGGEYPDWQSWSTRYLYGTRMLQWVADEFGTPALGELVWGHSGRFPYAIDRPPVRVAGRDYQAIYREMVGSLEDEFWPEIGALRRAGLTPHRVLTDSGFLTSGPRWMGPGSLVYTSSQPDRPGELRRLDLGQGPPRFLTRRVGLGHRPTPLAGQRLAFTQVEVHRPWAGGQLRADLYSVALDGGGVERLSRGERITEADYDPRQDRFVTVRKGPDGDRLATRLAEPGADPRVLLAEPGARYDTPAWSPDGRWVAFSRKVRGGHARLALLDVATGELTVITPDGSQAGFPSWSPDGSRIAFSWDRTGIFDLYTYAPADGSCVRLTRMLGGAFEPDWAPDGSRLAFTSYSSRGYDVALLELADALGETVDVEPERAAVPAPAPARQEAPAGRPYAALPRALPTFWLPDLITDHEGAGVGVWTAGHDPLQRHKYYAAGYWPTASRRAYGQGIYVNDVTYPTLGVQGWKLPSLHADLFETPGTDYDYWEENRGVRLFARQNLPRVLRFFSLGVSWAWEQVARLSDVGDDLDGRADLAATAFSGRTNPLALNLLYDSAFPYDNFFTVGAEAGTRFEVQYRLRHAALGAELDTQDVVADLRQYLPLPGLDHTVLMVRGKGGVGRGEVPLQGLFQLGGTGGEFPLRGYAPRSARGEAAALITAELRFPLWPVYRGFRDWPVFLAKLQGAVFAETGRVWQGDDETWRRGVGGEVRVDTLLGYYAPTTLVLGYAHGFDEDGAGRFYLGYGAAF